MFAFALYNKIDNTLYIARDRVEKNHYIIIIKKTNLYLVQIFHYLKSKQN